MIIILSDSTDAKDQKKGKEKSQGLNLRTILCTYSVYLG